MPVKVIADDFFNRQFLPLANFKPLVTYEVDYKTTEFDLVLDYRPYWILQVSNLTQRFSFEQFYNNFLMFKINTEYEIEKSEKKYDSNSIQAGTIETKNQKRWSEPEVKIKYFSEEKFIFFDLLNIEIEYKFQPTFFKGKINEIDSKLKDRPYFGVGLDLASVRSNYAYWLNIFYRSLGKTEIPVWNENTNYLVSGGDLATIQIGIQTEIDLVSIGLEYELVQKNTQYFRSEHYKYTSPEEFLTQIGIKLQHCIHDNLYWYTRFYTITHGDFQFYVTDIEHSRSSYSENGFLTGLSWLY